MTRAVIAKPLRRLALPLAVVLVVACATDSGSKSAGRAPAAPVPAYTASTESTSLGRDNAIASYRDYLARYPHSAEYDSITRRLADLLLEQAADLQLAAATTPGEADRLEAEARQAYTAAIGPKAEPRRCALPDP